MREAASSTRAESIGSAALWFGVFGGPAAWCLQILIGYNVEEIVCASGSQSQTVLGIGVEVLIVALHIGLTCVTLAAGLVSYRCWRRAGEGDASTGGRARWMAAAGMMVSILFLIIIVSGFVPALFLETCDPPL